METLCLLSWSLSISLPFILCGSGDHLYCQFQPLNMVKIMIGLMWISFALIFIVQFITQALLHYFAYKYRGQKGKKALFYADNDKLEFIWTVIPVITLSGLILYGLYTWNVIMNVDEDENPLVIELYAQQFSWTARYAGDDNVLGDANVRLIDIDKANTLGIE